MSDKEVACRKGFDSVGVCGDGTKLLGSKQLQTVPTAVQTAVYILLVLCKYIVWCCVWFVLYTQLNLAAR